MATAEQTLDAAFASYGDRKPPAGFNQSGNPEHTISDPSTGLYVTTYYNQDSNEYIVAFRGTENGRDWVNNSQRGWPQYEQKQNEIQNLLTSLTSSGAKVGLTGHSLGGALAQFAAYDYAASPANSGDDISMTTWNALGGKWALEQNRDFDPSVMKGVNATHYYRYDDLVSRLGEGHVGGITMMLQDAQGIFEHILSAHGYDELKEGLRLGGKEWSPSYIEISDVGQAIAGNVLDGILKISDGEYGQGLGRILNGIVPLISPRARQELADDFSVLSGNALAHEALALGYNAVDATKWLMAQTRELAGDMWSWLKDAVADGYFATTDFLNGFMDQTGEWLSEAASDFQDAIAAALRRLIDPIIIDLDGDGIEFIPRSDSSVFFDMDGDGRTEWTSWVSKDDGFLVIDENRNGKIDSISELIGDQSRSGFAELITYDSNGDEILDSSDVRWAKLRVWQDANENGLADADELKKMVEIGIKSIDLRYTEVRFIAKGNRIHETSIFEYDDGSVGTIVDAWLDVDNVAQDVGLIDTGNNKIDQLPNIRRFGDVAGLRESMLADNKLTNQVKGLVGLTTNDLGDARAMVEKILYRWAGTSGVAVDSRGPNFDGRKLATLEKFLGTPFSVNGNADPEPQAVPSLERAWGSLIDGIQGRLLLAGPLEDVLSNVVYDEGADRYLTIGGIQAVISALQQAQPNSGTLTVAEFWAAVIPVIDRLAGDAGVDTDSTEHRENIMAALADTGLDRVQDFLSQGIQPLALPESGVVSENGAFKLSNEAEDIILSGSAQAVFGMGGDDRMKSHNSSWSASVMLDGGAGKDYLEGTPGDDWLDGGRGADTMIGWGGNDTYVVDNAGDRVIEYPNYGADTVRSSVNHTLASHVENLVLLGTARLKGKGNEGNNSLTGNDAVNVLSGEGGNDILDGGAGADRLIGGTGDDTYWVDHKGDLVIERRNGGWDTVHSDLDYSLPAQVENLVLGGTANLTGTGNSLANQLKGNSGANLLDGGAGGDALYGGLGDDVFVVDHYSDRVYEDSEAGTDTVRSKISYVLSSLNVENLILTGSADLNGTGNAAANRLTGNRGANILDGQGGADTLIGGAGDDTYIVDDPADRVIEKRNKGVDQVRSAIDFTLGDEVEHLLLSGSADLGGVGNSLDNRLVGNDGANLLRGGDGNDILDGGRGADTLKGGAGDDTYYVDNVDDRIGESPKEGTDVVYSGVSWILGDNVEHLVLTGWSELDGKGNRLANTLTGNDYDNVLDGGRGGDTLIGSNGDDTYVVEDANDVVVEYPSQGTDLVRSSVDYVLGDFQENLVLLGTAELRGNGNELRNQLTGNAGPNRLTGEGGDDTLDGGAGADHLIGGAGNDTYFVDDLRDRVIEEYDAGTDVVHSRVRYVLPATVENLVLLGTDDLKGVGNTLNNSLTGNSGANILDGGQGADTLSGGLGDDTYIVDNSSDRVYENTDGGIDEVRSRVSFTLADSLEHLSLTGDADVNGTGNASDNTLKGNSGANSLDGRAGADTMIGGKGDDVYIVDDIGDRVVERANEGVDEVRTNVDFVLGDHLDHLTLLGTAAKGAGNSLANRLMGNSAANVLTGGSGDDSLDGAAGSDTLEGGRGDDAYYVDDVNDRLKEKLNAGTDTVYSNVSWILGKHFEELVLTGRDPLDGKGNELANTLTGNGSDNVLDGGRGADTLIGGNGDDTYVVDDKGDLVIEYPHYGTDTVRSSVDFALGNNLDHLVLLGTARLTGVGNEVNNNLTGNVGANLLRGEGGNDTLDGGAGSDKLIGGAGYDSLTGGTGRDVFAFLTSGDGRDSLTDFKSGKDKIHVASENFGDLPLGALDAGRFVATGTPLKTDDAVFIYDEANGNLSFDSNGSEYGGVTQIAVLTGSRVLVASDIEVVAAAEVSNDFF